MGSHRLDQRPVHLGLGATAEIEPTFTGEPAWYERYVERHAEDGREARLVAEHTFAESWDMWEMHPEGAEVVIVTEGALTLHQERAGENVSVHLRAGEYAINEPGTWHTADVDDSATAIFITPGVGTEHRPR